MTSPSTPSANVADRLQFRQDLVAAFRDLAAGYRRLVPFLAPEGVAGTMATTVRMLLVDPTRFDGSSGDDGIGPRGLACRRASDRVGRFPLGWVEATGRSLDEADLETIAAIARRAAMDEPEPH